MGLGFKDRGAWTVLEHLQATVVPALAFTLTAPGRLFLDAGAGWPWVVILWFQQRFLGDDARGYLVICAKEAQFGITFWSSGPAPATLAGPLAANVRCRMRPDSFAKARYFHAA